jgi:hypothetical protein
MIKYISAILIPCLLLQLCSCHSTKYLSSEELRHNYSYDPITITTKDGREFIIKKNVNFDEIEKDSTTIYCSDFYWLDDSIILSKNSIGLSKEKDNTKNMIKILEIEKVKVPKELINEISVIDNSGTYKTVTTVLPITIIGVIGMFVGFIILVGASI